MLLILADYIITQNKNRDIIKNGAVLVKDNKIKDVGNANTIKKKYAKKIKKIIKTNGQVAMPGLINAHTHLAMALLRGFADDMPLEEWWFKKIFPAEARLKKEDIYLGSLLGGMEMIKSGTTTFADFYFFVDEIAKAAETLGLRANIGIPVLDFPGPEFKKPADVFRALPKILKRWKKNNLINFSLAPHMLQTVSLDNYRACKKNAGIHKILMQTHLAETQQEIKHSLKFYKKTPVKLLAENKILSKNLLAAHCCHLTDKDIKLLADNCAHIVHCPSSNMKLASGIMPFSKLLKAGINICLGTDGACSNNSLDMFSEMKIAALLHKSAEKNPVSANAQDILDAATINGAKALNMQNKIGSIEPDKYADLILIDFKQPHLMPAHNIISNIVYAANGNDVQTMLINGKIIMENKKILSCSEGKVLKKTEKFAAIFTAIGL